MVGGSWRALAQLDMALSDHPLPIVHQHAMPIDRPAALAATLAQLDKQGARELGLSTTRLATLPEANLLLAALVDAAAAGAADRVGLRHPRRACSTRRSTRGCGRATRWSRRRARRGQGWAASRSMANCSTPGSRPCSTTIRPARGCGSPPACCPTSPGRRIPISAPTAASTWRCTAIGWGSTRAGRVMLAQALFTAFGGGKTLPYPAIAALCAAGRDRARDALGPGDPARPAAQRRRRGRAGAQPARAARRRAAAEAQGRRAGRRSGRAAAEDAGGGTGPEAGAGCCPSRRRSARSGRRRSDGRSADRRGNPSSPCRRAGSRAARARR